LSWRWRLIVSVVGIRRTCRIVWITPARGNFRVVGIDEVRIVGVVTVRDAVIVTVTCRTIDLSITVCVGVLTVRDAVSVTVRVVGVGVCSVG
jgi:hypothetical protein